MQCLPDAVRRALLDSRRRRYAGMVVRNFFQALVAVLVGNAIYFLVLWRYLPPPARHGIGRIDLGLLVDFWVCATCFGVVKFMVRKKRP